MRKREKGLSLMTILFIFLFNITSQGSITIATPSNADYEVKEDTLVIDDRISDYDNEFRATYSVEIPKSIHMQRSIDNNCFEARYELKVSNLNIDDERSCLVIKPDATFNLTTSNKDDIVVYIEQEEIEFSNLLQDDLADLHITTGHLYTEEPLSSASWKGSFSFNISMLDLGEATEIVEKEETEKKGTTSNADKESSKGEEESEVVNEIESITSDIEESIEKAPVEEVNNNLESETESADSSEIETEGSVSPSDSLESEIESSDSSEIETEGSVSPSDSLESEIESPDSSEIDSESSVSPSDSLESEIESSDSLEVEIESSIEPSESLEESNSSMEV